MSPILIAWVLQSQDLAPDVSASPIANAPVGGKLGGEKFLPTRVIWKRLGATSVKVRGELADQSQQHTLTFRTGEDFMADQEIAIWITFDPRMPLTPRTWHWRPTEFGTDLHRKQLYPVSKTTGSVARGLTTIFTSMKSDSSFSDRFSAHLQFLRVEGDTLVGRIALMLPDKYGSYLNGTFRAKIER